VSVVEFGIDAIERGWVPDPVTRLAIRRLCRKRLLDQQSNRENGAPLIEKMRIGDIAQVPEKANEQHYEVSADFFKRVLGPRLKYSSCYFAGAQTTLAEAEEDSLRITCERAELADGQQVLELGCGWGSLSLWIAEKYPNSQITSVSNSNSQRAFIVAACEERGIKNLQVITADMNCFSTENRFDRVVSVEMFEHMRNYEKLLHRIATWLVDDGKLFVHIFCNTEHCYPFETDGATNWMGRHFFSGGIMPSEDVFEHFRHDLRVEKSYRWNGLHYKRTLEAWLVKMDQSHSDLMEILENVYGSQDAGRWFNRWRMFFMASAELFGFGGGDQWFVSHYLLKKL
jgi:cyclopropane-fatty-acyl-phospholipid synthase